MSFYEFMFHDLAYSVNLYDCFGISKKSIKIAEDHCRDDMRTFIRRGVDIRRQEEVGGDNIAETFFFYPIRGALQTISQLIKNSLTQ